MEYVDNRPFDTKRFWSERCPFTRDDRQCVHPENQHDDKPHPGPHTVEVHPGHYEDVKS